MALVNTSLNQSYVLCDHNFPVFPLFQWLIRENPRGIWGNKGKQRGISECFLFFKNTINHLPVSHLLGQTSGTTVTFVVVDQWTVTVACVGDSRCILDPRGGVVSALTVDHRLEENEEE